MFLYWQHVCKVVASMNSLSVSFEPEKIGSIYEFRELWNLEIQEML